MSVSGLTSSARRLAAVLLISALPLAACERGPGTPSAYSPSMPEAPPATELAGAPTAQPAPPPPVEAAPAPPPPELAPAPPALAPAPPASRGDEVIYNLGPVVPTQPDTRAVRPIAAAAPAPARAPVQTARATHRRRHHSHTVAAAQPAVATPAPRAKLARNAAPAPKAAAPATRRVATASAPKAAPAKVAPVAAAPKPVARVAPAAPVKAAPTATPAAAPAPLPAPVDAKPIAEKPAAATATASKRHGKASRTDKSAEHTAKLAALQAALREAVVAEGVLAVPSLPADRPGDVTLTLPAEFSAQVRAEAEKQGLGDDAASVNLTAGLAGDGYAVTPDATQSQPLTVGQPTVFRWTATAQPGQRGPLRADVGADLLGGGSETLVLGALEAQPKAAAFSSRALGAGLLALIAVLVVAWLARVRRTPAQQEGRRRAAQRSRNGINGDRPFDMTEGDRRP